MAGQYGRFPYCKRNMYNSQLSYSACMLASICRSYMSYSISHQQGIILTSSCLPATRMISSCSCQPCYWTAVRSLRPSKGKFCTCRDRLSSPLKSICAICGQQQRCCGSSACELAGKELLDHKRVQLIHLMSVVRPGLLPGTCFAPVT